MIELREELINYFLRLLPKSISITYDEKEIDKIIEDHIRNQINCRVGNVKTERPKLEDFYPDGTDVKTIQNAFIENIEIYNYINALDLYIDEIESKSV